MTNAHGIPGNWAVKGKGKKNETNEQLLKRHKKQVQHKRDVLNLKNNRFFKQKDTKRITRLKAVKRAENRERTAREKLFS